MPITWRATGIGCFEVVFSDPYTIADSEKVMKDIFADAGAVRPLRFLIDVRQSTPPDTEFVTNAITFWQLHVSSMWGAKIAVLTASERQAEMAHMSERTAESRDLPFTLRVFGRFEREEAERWLEASG